MSEEDKPPNPGGNKKGKTVFTDPIMKSFKGVEKQIPEPTNNGRGHFREALREALHKFLAEKNQQKLEEGEGASKVDERKLTEVTPPNSNGASPSGAENNPIDNEYSNVEEVAQGTSNALPPESPDSQSGNRTTPVDEEGSSLVDKDPSALEVPSGAQAVESGVFKSSDEQQQPVTTTTSRTDKSTNSNGNPTSCVVRLSPSGKTFENVEVVEEVSSSDSETCSNEAEVEMVSSTVLSPTITDEDLRQDSARVEDNERSISQNITEEMSIVGNPSSADKDKEGTSSVAGPEDAADDSVNGRKRPGEETNVSGSSKRCRANTDNNKENENETTQSSTGKETDQASVVEASTENIPGDASFQTVANSNDANTQNRAEDFDDDDLPELTEDEARARGIRTLRSIKMEIDGEPPRTGPIYIPRPRKPKPRDPNYVVPVITLSDSEDDELELQQRYRTAWPSLTESSSLRTTTTPAIMSTSSRAAQAPKTASSSLPTTTTPAIMSTSSRAAQAPKTASSSLRTTTTPAIMSISTRAAQAPKTASSSLPTTTTPAIMSTSSRAAQAPKTASSSLRTTTTPAIMSISTTAAQAPKTASSSLPTTTTPAIMSTSSRAAQAPKTASSSLRTTTTPAIMSISTTAAQAPKTASSSLRTTTTPAILSTSTRAAQAPKTASSSLRTTTTPAIMSISTTAAQAPKTASSSLPTTTTPAIMSTSSRAAQARLTASSSLPTTTTPAILSTSTSTVVSAATPISSILITTTPNTCSATSESIVEPVTTETSSFVTNAPMPITDDAISRPTILPMPSLDPEASSQSVALSSDIGISSAPTMSSNSSTTLLPSSNNQTEENNDIPVTTSTQTAVTVSEVTNEVTLASRNDEKESLESGGTANAPLSLGGLATTKSSGDDLAETTAQVTPFAIADIKVQPDIEEDDMEMPILRIRKDIFVDDDDDEDIEVVMNQQTANEPMSLAQVIADFSRSLTSEECNIDSIRSLAGVPLPTSASELVAVSRILTPDILSSLPAVSVSRRNSSPGVPVSSAAATSATVQIPGTSSGSSSSSSSVTAATANGSVMAPTTVQSLLTCLETEGIPSTTASCTPVTTVAISAPVTSASPIASVSSALVPMPTTSSVASCSTVEVPTTSAQEYQRRTSSPAIANSPWSELEAPMKDMNAGMDIIVKAAEENLAYLKQLAASVKEPSASIADLRKKMSSLSEARENSFKYHDTVDNVIISLRLKHPSLSIPEPRVRMETAKPTVEELAAYFEVLLEAVVLSRRQHINERMRGVLTVQITRIVRILGHYMHVPENFSRSDQTFTNVLAILTTKDTLTKKYSSSNLNYMLLNFWQCIRGVTRDSGYAKGAMMDHTNLGPKNFMDRVNKFKHSYERNVVAKGALQAAQGTSQDQAQSNQSQQQVANQTSIQQQQQSRSQPSAMLQNQQQQQQGATVAPVVRHQQHQFATPLPVVQQQPQQHQYTTNQSQIMQQQSQQRQFATATQVVQQQPQQNQYANQSQVTQQQSQYTNQSQVTQQQSQYTNQSQVIQQQPQQHHHTNQSQVTQQLQQPQYATQQQTMRHPQQQQQLGSQQQQQLNPPTNLQSQNHRQSPPAYLRVLPIRQEHTQNASQFQGQARTAHPQHAAHSSSSLLQNQLAQHPSTSQQRHFHQTPPQQHTAQQFSAPRQSPPNTASLLERQAHFNMASQQQQISGGQVIPQSQYLPQQPSAQQVHTSSPRSIVVTTRPPGLAQPRLFSQVTEHPDVSYARQQLANANGLYRQRQPQQQQQQQRTQQQMPAPQFQQHRLSRGSPQLLQQQLNTQQQFQLQQQFTSQQQLQQQQMTNMQQQQHHQMSNMQQQQHHQVSNMQQQQHHQVSNMQQQQQQMTSMQQLQQQQQITTQQQVQRQQAALNPASNGNQQQQPGGNTYADDDIEILEVRPTSNPPVSRSPVETNNRILLHTLGGEQIGSVAFTPPNVVASPQGQAASLSRRSSLDSMTLEELLSNTPAANRVAVTPTNVVRPNSRSMLSPISPPANVAGRRTNQDAQTAGTNNQHSAMRVGQSARHPNRNGVQQGHVSIQLNQQVSSMPYNQQNQQLTLNYQQESEPSIQAGSQAQPATVPGRVSSTRPRSSSDVNSPSGTLHYGNGDHGSGQRSTPGNYSSTPGPELRISSVTSLANAAPNSSRRLSQSTATIQDTAYAQVQANRVYFPDAQGNSIALQQTGQSNNTVNYNVIGNFSGNNFGNT